MLCEVLNLKYVQKPVIIYGIIYCMLYTKHCIKHFTYIILVNLFNNLSSISHVCLLYSLFHSTYYSHKERKTLND